MKLKYLLDSSVIVAAFVESHPRHNRALPWLVKSRSGSIDWVVASHSLAEVYHVLTTLPITPRISSIEAYRLIKENIPTGVISHLTTKDYRLSLEFVSQLGLVGGIVYDALIVRAALKSNADRIVTFNIRDFMRVWPKRADDLIIP